MLSKEKEWLKDEDILILPAEEKDAVSIVSFLEH